MVTSLWNIQLFTGELKCKNMLEEYHWQILLRNHLHSESHSMLLKQVTIEQPHMAFMSLQGIRSQINVCETAVLFNSVTRECCFHHWGHMHGTVPSNDIHTMSGTKFASPKSITWDFTPATWQGKSPQIKKMHWRSSGAFKYSLPPVDGVASAITDNKTTWRTSFHSSDKVLGSFQSYLFYFSCTKFLPQVFLFHIVTKNLKVVFSNFWKVSRNKALKSPEGEKLWISTAPLLKLSLSK